MQAWSSGYCWGFPLNNFDHRELRIDLNERGKVDGEKEMLISLLLLPETSSSSPIIGEFSFLATAFSGSSNISY